jgi:putative salt-induced outer membrane protein
MSRKLLCALALPLTLSSPFVFAADTAGAQKPAASPWKASAELGFVQTNGNSKTQTLNVKSSFKHKVNKWSQKLELEAFSSSDSNKTTGERYSANANSNYHYTDRVYSTVTANYQTDRFSGYDYQASLTLGGGYSVIKQDRQTLDLESGLGYRSANPSQGSMINEGIVRLSAEYNLDVSKSSHFSQTLSTEAGRHLVSSKSVTALSAKVADNLAMKTTYTVRHVNKAPEGTYKTDTETAVTLVYSF